MSEFQPFLMERMMSLFEQDVDYNLSESGVHPITLKGLLSDDPGEVDRLLATELNYPYVNGTPQLRARIAALYDGARSVPATIARYEPIMKPLITIRM